MKLSLLRLDGDGIGPEIVDATCRVVSAVATKHNLNIDWQAKDIGFTALEASGSTIPEDVIDTALQADGVILGPVSHNDYPPLDQGGLNPSGVLRKRLQLFANIRPATSYPGIVSPVNKEIDLVIVRENLEGFYADRNMIGGAGEFTPVDGVALAFRKITAHGSERIARVAFNLAQRRSAKQVTAVHKANVMRMTDGLFLDCVRKVSKEFPQVTYNEVLVDAAAALLVRDPAQFDVVVTTNMFGDILSDLASELAGGLGLAASLNLGGVFSQNAASEFSAAIAQAQHGSAPELAGKGVANPTSLIASSAMLLAHLGATQTAENITSALKKTLKDPSKRTADIGGTASTTEFIDGLISAI